MLAIVEYVLGGLAVIAGFAPVGISLAQLALTDRRDEERRP